MNQIKLEQSMNNCIICVNPSMSLPMVFSKIKSQGYRIFSIMNRLKSTKIDHEYIRLNSDVIFEGSDQIEVDYSSILDIIEKNSLNIVGVMNGIDASIDYSDYLAKRFVDQNINLDYSKTRLNKHAVNQIIASKNYSTIASLELSSATISAEIMTEITKLGWPLVAKPSENTAAMADFRLIHHISELEEYLLNTLNKENSYYSDCVVKKIILQQYIPIKDYDEFVLDFISYNGKHYLQAIAYYEKETINKNTSFIYRHARPVTFNEIPNIQFIVDYMTNVLDALNVQYGLTHNEVFWDHKTSCFLVESNSRIGGSGLVDAYSNCYGYSPIDGFLNASRNQQIDYPLQRVSHSLCMCLYNFFVDNPTQIHIENIKSFQAITTFYPEKKTTMDFKNYTRAENVAAMILLDNKDPNILNSDINELLRREQTGNLFS